MSASTEDLTQGLAAMEERMETHLGGTESAVDRLRADMARRDKENLRWQVGLWISAVVVIGVLIRWLG